MSELSHFEKETKNVLNLYKKIFGKEMELDMESMPEDQ